MQPLWADQAPPPADSRWATNWPVPELNHTVVAFAFHETGGDRVFHIWDPNDPDGPGSLTFEHDALLSLGVLVRRDHGSGPEPQQIAHRIAASGQHLQAHVRHQAPGR